MIDMEMKEKLDMIFFFSCIGLELPRLGIKKPLAYNQLPKLHLLCCVLLCMCRLGVEGERLGLTENGIGERNFVGVGRCADWWNWSLFQLLKCAVGLGEGKGKVR